MPLLFSDVDYFVWAEANDSIDMVPVWITDVVCAVNADMDGPGSVASGKGREPRACAHQEDCRDRSGKVCAARSPPPPLGRALVVTVVAPAVNAEPLGLVCDESFKLWLQMSANRQIYWCSRGLATVVVSAVNSKMDGAGPVEIPRWTEPAQRGGGGHVLVRIG